MNKELFEIMKNIENLSVEDLKKLSVWIEYTLHKRVEPPCHS